MNIAVVDDNARERELTGALVSRYAQEHNLTARITEFSCSEKFLAVNEHFDIAFLDIYMNEISGIEAARQLRMTNERTVLIFLTASRDHAVEAFEVNASNYLVKPFSEKQLFAALDRVMHRKFSESAVTLRCENGLQTFMLRDVEFFEVQQHSLYINLSNGSSAAVRLSMKQLREQIGSNADYIPCGASFLVNLRYIVSLSNLTLITKSGRKIPIPRRSISEIEKAYLSYCRKAVGK